jgi:ribokinase
MADVTIIGSYIVALVIEADRLPVAGETVAGRNYRVTHGGKGSNMACCAARLGARTGFVGKVGRDNFGEDFLDLLRREGVATEGVLYAQHQPTAVGFIVCGPGGSNLIVIDSGANGEFSPADVTNTAIEGVVLSPLEIPLETALAGARIAAQRGIPAILNPAPAQDLRRRDLSSVFALTPNEGEARVALGLDAADSPSPAECARALLDLGPRNVIVTVGANGAVWAARDGLWHVPALAVEVVDTVGAGDAFNAGLAVGLAEGMPMERAVAMGVTAASLSTRRRDTIESYPRREEVDSRVDEVAARIERWPE